MTTGRKPTPSQLHRLHGSPGHVSKRVKAARAAEPIPPGDLTETPPEWLTERQKEFWSYSMQHAPRQLLKMIDREVLPMWVVAASLHRDAAEAIAREGTISTTTNGSKYQNPSVGVLNRQAVIMLKLASDLGFSPASRPRLSPPQPQPGFAPSRILPNGRKVVSLAEFLASAPK
jgi:P27 family predicted phage terminase small subunit